jgi:hypothetical protein
MGIVLSKTGDKKAEMRVIKIQRSCKKSKTKHN